MGQTKNSKIIKVLRYLRSVEQISMALFVVIILKWLFLRMFEQTEFTSNLFFWAQRLLELMAAIIGFNCINTKFYKIAIFASSIALSSFIKECLILAKIIQVNDPNIIRFEFILLTLFAFVLWRISKILSYSL